MSEIWKDIEGYEGLYQVSNLGRVKSLPHFRKNGYSGYVTKEKILIPSYQDNGYQIVNLYSDNKRKTHTIHRLVANCFISNPNNKPCVDHINTDKADNRVENLRWCTQSENCNNISTLKNMRNNQYYAIIQLTSNGEFIKIWDSASEISKVTGINRANITMCCNGKRKTAGGYKWSYVN